MKQNSYFALTIGPIYKTMALARETRELWAASYIFSHLMEKLVEDFSAFGDIVLPVKPALEDFTEVKIKPGLFPDRIIVMLNDDVNIVDLNNKLKGTKDDFFKSMALHSAKVIAFFESYFHIHSLRIELPESENPVQTINDLLDSKELSPGYVAIYDKNHIEGFLNKINKWGRFEELYGKYFCYPSVLEIAVNDLKDNDKGIKVDEIFADAFKKEIASSKPQTVDIIKQLTKKFNPVELTNEQHQFRYYHTYMAIVQADGDNLSKAINAMYFSAQNKGIEAVRHISRLLMQFGNKASLEISNYGGIPIYMGGDDLLFFAPVRNKNESIFHLIEKLDQLFEKTILKDTEVIERINEWNASITKENRRKKVTLSMSYGISMAYHKYPLWESLETARANLFETAKGFPGKNAVSFKVLKHSGQHYEALFAKSWKSYNRYFLALINEVIGTNNWQSSEKKITFLTSLQHKLDPLRPLLYRILVGREVDPSKASFLDAFINYIPDEFDREFKTERLRENFFNEGVHKNEGTYKFFKLSFEYLLQLYRDMEDVYGNNNATAEKAVDALYATLRLIQFYIQPDHKETD